MNRWKNALFIYPEEEGNRKDKINFYDLFPPVGVECIGATIKEYLEKITIIDMRYEKNQAKDYFDGVDVIGISCNWEAQKKATIKLLDEIPEGVFVILGGIYASENYKELIKECPRVDVLVRGDGEEAARDLFTGVSNSKIEGLSYRQGKKIIHNEERLIPEILTAYPDRSLRRYKYKLKAPGGVEIGVDTIMTSRGCQFKCEFCTHRLSAKGEERGWSYRSAENVVEEIKQIDADIIILSDDNFTGNMKRVEKICDLLIESGVKKTFLMESRLEIGLQPELLKKLWKVGFRAIIFGIESAQEKTLKRIGKGFTKEKALTAFKNINQKNWLTAGFFIIGYINESEKEILEIAPFAHELKLDFISHSKLRALKNSPLFDTLQELPEYHIDDRGRVYSDTLSTEDIFRIARQVMKNFYNPGQYLHILGKFAKSMLWVRLLFWKAMLLMIVSGIENKTGRKLLKMT